MESNRLIFEGDEMLIRTQFLQEGKGKGQRSRGLAHRGKVSDTSGVHKKIDRHELNTRKMDLLVVANGVTHGIRRIVGISK